MGPKAGMERHGKSRPPPGFDPQTLQPVASRYTNYAIPAHIWSLYWNKCGAGPHNSCREGSP